MQWHQYYRLWVHGDQWLLRGCSERRLVLGVPTFGGASTRDGSLEYSWEADVRHVRTRGGKQHVAPEVRIFERCRKRDWGMGTDGRLVGAVRKPNVGSAHVTIVQVHGGVG